MFTNEMAIRNRNHFSYDALSRRAVEESVQPGNRGRRLHYLSKRSGFRKHLHSVRFSGVFPDRFKFLSVVRDDINRGESCDDAPFLSVCRHVPSLHYRYEPWIATEHHMPMIKALLIVLFLCGIVEAGTHIMYGDVLPGGATSYIQNSGSDSSPSCSITNGTFSGNVTLSQGGNILLEYPGFPINQHGQIGWTQFGVTNGLFQYNDSGLNGILGIVSNGSGNKNVATLFKAVTDSDKTGIAIWSTGTIRLYDNTNSKYTALRSANTLSGNTTWILPTSDGIGYFKSDGSGNMSIINILTSTQTWTAGQILSPLSKSQLSSITPTGVGEQHYCTDCTNCLVGIATATTQGGFASQQAANRTTICN